MSIRTLMQNFRCERRTDQLRENAKQPAAARNTTVARMMGIPAVALAFVFSLIALCPPASAVSFDINGTVGPLLDGIAALIPSIVNLIVAVVPAIIILALVGFVVTFLDKILAMLHIK